MYRHNPRRRTSAGPAPVPNWSRLAKNDHVQVRLGTAEVMSGTIDMIAVDRSVFWLIRNDGAGRVMVCSGDDVAVIKLAGAEQRKPMGCTA